MFDDLAAATIAPKLGTALEVASCLEQRLLRVHMDRSPVFAPHTLGAHWTRRTDGLREVEGAALRSHAPQIERHLLLRARTAARLQIEREGCLRIPPAIGEHRHLRHQLSSSVCKGLAR